MKNSVPILLIAGAGSGVGKTSLTLGLAAALRRRGLIVQTFKVGPDYLDPTHLARASGRACYNLDGWMTGRDYIRRLASAKSQDADLAIVEGVMGLYDGASPVSPAGSTSKVLTTPMLASSTETFVSSTVLWFVMRMRAVTTPLSAVHCVSVSAVMITLIWLSSTNG